MDRVQKVDSSDDWGARHPFLEYSRQDSENAVLSVRVPLDHGQPKAPEPLIDHRPALKVTELIAVRSSIVCFKFLLV